MMSKKGCEITALKLIPNGSSVCIWMSAGLIKYKLCDRNYDCDNCPIDKAMRGDLAEGVPSKKSIPKDEIKQLVDGFVVPDGFFFHQGHSWVKIESADTATVGIDDFTCKLVGRIDHVKLPPIGSKLKQGERAWTIYLSHKSFDMLSPLEGEVISLNSDVVKNPALINESPYERGWLFRVRASRLNADLKNLLSKELARRWAEVEVEKLYIEANNNLGKVRFDGGVIIDGIAKSLDIYDWDRIVRRYLLIGD